MVAVSGIVYAFEIIQGRMNMRATDQRALPRSSVRLTRLGLGCAPIGGLYRAVPQEEAHATVDAAWDLGLRYFDTAPYYGYTRSERRLGEALRERPRDDYVISTKVGRLMWLDPTVQPGDSGWADPYPFRPHYDYSYDGVMRSYDDSCDCLGVDSIDILYVHDIGRATHGNLHDHYWRQLTKGGGFRALQSLRDADRVRAVGLGVGESEAAYAAMQECALDCTLLVGRYTLLEQDALSPLLDACVRHGNAIVVGAPFNSGAMSATRSFKYADTVRQVRTRIAALEQACREFGVPLQAAALQFPMAHPAVVSCIPGAHDAGQMRQNASWFEWPIPSQLWQVLKQRGLLDERAPVPEEI